MVRTLFILALALFLTACSSFSSRMQDLQLGMTESEVRSELGSDYDVVATRINDKGQTMTGWKYQESDKEPAYLVYFVDGKLAQFGEASALQSMPALGTPRAVQ